MIPRKIIIIRPDRLGDLILSLPVAQALKEKFPDCLIVYLAAPGPAAIAPMVPHVDRWITDKGQNGRLSLFELIQILRQGEYDHLIELKPSWRTAAVGFISNIPVRVGTGRRFYSFLYNRRLSFRRRGSGLHQSDLDLAMLKPLGINASMTLPALILPDSSKKAVGMLVGKSIKEYIVIHPGSGGSAPNWPLNYYRELANLILKETDVIITGLETSPDEFKGCLNLSGKTDLTQLAGILGCASVFISGSTGPLHMADALGTKCVSFFAKHADIDPVRWGPRRNMQNVITPDGLACNCRNLSKCSCLEQVTPELAFNKVKMVLDSKKSGTKSTP